MGQKTSLRNLLLSWVLQILAAVQIDLAYQKEEEWHFLQYTGVWVWEALALMVVVLVLEEQMVALEVQGVFQVELVLVEVA